MMDAISWSQSTRVIEGKVLVTSKSVVVGKSVGKVGKFVGLVGKVVGFVGKFVGLDGKVVGKVGMSVGRVGIVGVRPVPVKGLKSGEPGMFWSALVWSSSASPNVNSPGSSSVKSSSDILRPSGPSLRSVCVGCRFRRERMKLMLSFE